MRIVAPHPAPKSKGMGVAIMKKDANMIATKLEMALGGMPEKVPAGFRPTIEWAKIWRCGINRARNLCCQHTIAGKMERRIIKIKTPASSSFPVKHYKAIVK